LLSSATDVETAQRGYTITGDESFLEPYTSARPRIGAELAELRRLTRDNAEQQRRLDRLGPLLAERIANAAQNVQLRREQGFDAARLAVASGSGKALHDRVRALIAEMTNAELTLLAERQRVARRVASLTHTVIAGGSALAIFSVAVALFVVGRDFAGSRRAEAALQEANEQLEARVRERTAAKTAARFRYPSPYRRSWIRAVASSARPRFCVTFPIANGLTMSISSSGNGCTPPIGDSRKSCRA
jgi:CHASE3 domain sensor protein